LRHLDPETDFKVRRIVANVNEVSHSAVNEPSMGLYRIQEHVHRTLPQLVKRKNELKENLEHINGIQRIKILLSDCFCLFCLFAVLIFAMERFSF